MTGSHRPIEPAMTDPGETMVLCDGGPNHQKLIKVRMLSNLSEGQYRKDPACIWTNPKDQQRYGLYRWLSNETLKRFEEQGLLKK